MINIIWYWDEIIWFLRSLLNKFEWLTEFKTCGHLIHWGKDKQKECCGGTTVWGSLIKMLKLIFIIDIMDEAEAVRGQG